jgi:hypothetical protein
MIGKTTKLNLDRLTLPPAALVAALVFIVAGGISAIGRYTAPRPVAVPTPALAPIIIIATPVPAPAAEPLQVAAVEPARYVVAFAAPDGAVLGAIPAPDTTAIEARYGDGWYMVTWNGAPAWIRAADLGVPAEVADLAPTEAPRIVVVNAPAPAQPAVAPTYDPPTPPAPTLAPQQLVILDRQQWAQQATGR